MEPTTAQRAVMQERLVERLQDRNLELRADVDRLEEIKGTWPDWKRMIDEAHAANKKLIAQRDEARRLLREAGERAGKLWALADASSYVGDWADELDALEDTLSKIAAQEARS